jgi:hypothetical protein
LFVAQSLLLMIFLAHCANFTIIIRCTERLLQFIVAFLKLTYIDIMKTSQSKRNNARRGKVVRFEPWDLKLINVDPAIKASFE